MSDFHFLVDLLEQAKSFGYRQVPNGAELHGLCPHIAPEAWFHKRYKQLSTFEITEIESRTNVVFHDDTRRLYEFTNGLNLFSSRISIYGKRYSFSRKGDDVWQPFCVISANTIERPDNLSDTQYVIGGYSGESLLIGDSSKSEIIRKKPNGKKVISKWPDLITMLKEETARLSACFNEKGVQIQKV